MTTHESFPARSLRPACVLAATLVAGSAFAEGPGDNFWFQLEYFYPTISSTARLDFPGTNVPGTKVELEDDLGLSDRKGTPYVLAGMRIGENWRIELEYYRLKRSATLTIDREIDWGDTTFPVGGSVSSKFDTDIYRLTGGWSFYRTPTAEAGLGFGLHMTDFKTQLSGQGSGPGGVSFQTEGSDQLVPLPTIGLYGSWLVADSWLVRGRIDYLSLSYEQYDGELVNAMATVSWRFAKNWGVGLGYRYVRYVVESTKSNFHGEIKYDFRGPTIFLEAAF
jgi:hypothetical protein